MAAQLGGSQVSALLESVPGIANVLRSPVADAMVNLIRAGAGVGPFHREDAEELVQFAVRRGLIGPREGDEVMAAVGASGRGRTRPKPVAKKAKPRPPSRPKARAAQRPVAKKGGAKKAAKKAARKPAKKVAGRAKKR